MVKNPIDKCRLYLFGHHKLHIRAFLRQHFTAQWNKMPLGLKMSCINTADPRIHRVNNLIMLEVTGNDQICPKPDCFMDIAPAASTAEYNLPDRFSGIIKTQTLQLQSLSDQIDHIVHHHWTTRQQCSCSTPVLRQRSKILQPQQPGK